MHAQVNGNIHSDETLMEMFRFLLKQNEEKWTKLSIMWKNN